MLTNFQFLKGHSGCVIEKIFDPATSRTIVRKTAKDINYNTRMATQIKKQRTYSHPGIKAPRVFDVKYTPDGLLYFDMEYVEGRSLAQYVREEPLGNVLLIIQKLLIPNESTLKVETDDDPLVRSKINLLSTSLRNKDVNSPCGKALLALRSFQFKTHPCQCHGDLTFENIIITPQNEIYLIDFLDSFCDCWEIDVSKLLQDAFCGWSYRFDVLDEQTLDKLSQISVAIEEVYANVAGGEALDQMYAMLLLTLLRIYPYVSDNATESFLDRAVINVLGRCRF